MQIKFEPTLKSLQSRRHAEQLEQELNNLPPGSGTVSVEVIDLDGRIGFVHIFREENGNFYAIKRSLDPRHLYNRLKRKLKVEEITIAFRENRMTIRQLQLSTGVIVDSGKDVQDCLIDYSGPGWYSLDDQEVYRRGEFPTFSRIKITSNPEV